MKKLHALLALGFTLTAAVTRAQVVIPDNNLIANGEFMARDPQQRPLRWYTGLGLQTVSVYGKEHHMKRADDHSLRVIDSSTTAAVLVRSEKHIAAPGVTYHAQAFAKSKDGVGAFRVEFWNQNNKMIGSAQAKPKAETDWQPLNIILKAPDSTTHVTVSIFTLQAEKGEAFWDDVSLAYEEEYKPGLTAGQRELFMDDYRIEKLVDVQRVVHQGAKSKILMGATEPWEGTSTYIYGTILKDEAGPGYRMWYTAYLDKEYFMCYATSKDGITWIKPKLGVYEFRGSKQNNIVNNVGGTLVYNPAESDVSKRYKLMAFESGDKEKSRFGFNIYYSADGLKWRRGTEKPVLPYGDVSNVAFDKENNQYIATTKQRMLVSNTSVTPGKMDRMAFVSVSKDFETWAAPGAPGSKWTLAVEGDVRDDLGVMSRGGIEANVYGMPVYPYQGAYIGLPWMFDIRTYNKGEFANTGDGVIQPQVAFSRDLRHWARPVRDAVLPVGQSGAWDDGTLYTCSNMQTTDKEMMIYFGAMNLPHGGAAAGQTQYGNIARATWRRDGMVSLTNGGYDEGSIFTKPVTFTGKQMHVNAKLNAGGYVKVELLDKNDKPLPGFTTSQAIIGDQYDAVVTWGKNADVSKLADKTVKIRFRLKGGNVYSYWFK